MSSVINEIMTQISALIDHNSVPASGQETADEDCALPKIGTAREWITYGWHNPHLPPECRSAILRGEKFEVDAKTDLYTITVILYEKISGRRAPCSFEVYKDWKKQIRAGGGLCGGLDAEERERLIRAVEDGTHRRREERDPVRILDILRGTAI